jgi:hypothetical protein
MDRQKTHYGTLLQAHWAGAKRQQHLPKELVLLYKTSTNQFIHQIQTTDNMDRQNKMLKVAILQHGFGKSGALVLG